MTSPSQAPPTGMRLMRRAVVSKQCYSVSQYDDQIYVAGSGGVYRGTSNGQSSCVISVDGFVHSVSVNDGGIYTLVYERDTSWSVRVYDSDYRPTRSWRHIERSGHFNQMAVRKDSVLVSDRDSKTIIQYSLTGEVERRIPCPILNNTHTLNGYDIWMCVMSSRLDSVIVSCDGAVSCVHMSTGHCVWSTVSLDKPTAVCCDDADRVYVGVGLESDTIQISVLDGVTGKAVFKFYTRPNFILLHLYFID